MTTVRSITGAWLRTVAKNAFPTKTPRGRVEALADALEISRRSCYAYVAEERRVPEEVEQRFITLFGPVADDGWRLIEMQRPHRKKEHKKLTQRTMRRLGGQTKEHVEFNRTTWRGAAMHNATVLSQDSLGHAIRWEQNNITVGQCVMVEENLDEEEARLKHPQNFDSLAADQDWLAICQLCGLVGGVDDRVREVNGMLFRVSCGTYTYKVS
jgi:hypothetical protein